MASDPSATSSQEDCAREFTDELYAGYRFPRRLHPSKSERSHVIASLDTLSTSTPT